MTMATLAPGDAGRRFSTLHVPSGRRLSALVPDAVARRLSTLGLARNGPTDSLVEQGKSLCAQYMRSRTEGTGKRWRWQGNGTVWAGARLVFPRLSRLGRYLERARPRLYAAIGRHAETSLPPDIDPADLVYSVGMELFKNDITWGKVVSLMAICGALAKAAAQAERTEIIPAILEAATAVIQGPLLPWLHLNGGWLGLVEHCQPLEPSPPEESHKTSRSLLTAGCIISIFLTIFLLKNCL